MSSSCIGVSGGRKQKAGGGGVHHIGAPVVPDGRRERPYRNNQHMGDSMKLIKTLGLMVVAAVAAMAIAGAGTAMATGSTALCKEHKDPCPAGALYGVGQVIEGLATSPVLLANFFGFTGSISCEHSVVAGKIETSALANPLQGKIDKITFTGDCLSTFGGSCTVTTVKTGLLDLLRTALNLGTATSLGNEIKVVCGGFPSVECTFGGTPQLHVEGSPVKHLTAKEAVLTAVSGSACPSSPRWDALYKIIQPAGNVFITT
jgi:hypothetical protein